MVKSMSKIDEKIDNMTKDTDDKYSALENDIQDQKNGLINIEKNVLDIVNKTEKIGELGRKMDAQAEFTDKIKEVANKMEMQSV